MPGERIEPWMMDEVKKFIEHAFLETTVDYFPRGNGSAVLFRAEEGRGLLEIREDRIDHIHLAAPLRAWASMISTISAELSSCRK